MNQVKFGNEIISYSVRRGKREKTVALHIQPNSTVVVLSPQFLTGEKIREIVLRRARWISQKQETLKKQVGSIAPKEFVSGESFPYLGRQYRLKIVRSAGTGIPTCKLVKGRFRVEINNRMTGKTVSRTVARSLMNWYMARAQEKINERVERCSVPAGKKPVKIMIRDQEKRWGSCSVSGVLRFNWKVAMMPLSVLDYVIAHELCHLFIKDHSDKFWNKVGSIIPDYKKKRQWLRENGLLLAELLNYL